MKNNIRKLVESLFKDYYPLHESFKSSTIQTFFNKIKEELSNKNEKDVMLIGYWMNGSYGVSGIHEINDFKFIAKEFGLGNFKDEYLWKGNEKYQNESGVYTHDEIMKNLGISSNKMPYIFTEKTNIYSIAACCAKVPTVLLGLVTQDNNGNVKKFNCGIFIDPKKGTDFINYIKEHNKKKENRSANKRDTELNFDFSLENAIKTNEDIQTYLKSASDEQKELLKKIINETQRGDMKYLADLKYWLDERSFNYIKSEIAKAIKNEGNDKNKQSFKSKISIEDLKNIKFNEFTKVEAKNKLKMFRYNVIRLLCQPKEQELKESYWFKRLNDNCKKYILNAYQLLHKDLKELSDDDKQSIKKQIRIDWKNIITNHK